MKINLLIWQLVRFRIKKDFSTADCYENLTGNLHESFLKIFYGILISDRGS
jgi:hypothetical protein